MSTYSLIKILGIDPGINHTGYSFGLYDPQKKITTVQEYGVFEASALAKKFAKKDFNKYGSIVSLDFYEEEFSKLVEKYKPDYVACESPFFNPRMPNAFLSLSMCLLVIRRVLRKSGMILYTYAPKAAKAIVSTGTANKVDMAEGIHQHKDLKIIHTKERPKNSMVEHESDSVGIIYTHVKLYLEAKK